VKNFKPDFDNSLYFVNYLQILPELFFEHAM